MKPTVIYSDEQIRKLMDERKVLPDNWEIQLKKKSKEVLVTGDNGNQFCFGVRFPEPGKLDFSVRLLVMLPNSNERFMLRRYNRGARNHRNHIERNSVGIFHIHYATERYQQKGYNEEQFAKKTSRYTDVFSAIQCLLQDGNFQLPSNPNSQLDLFYGV
jgi:hypothetical protein